MQAGRTGADDEHMHSPQTRDGRCRHPARDTPHTTRPRPSRPPHRGAGPRARAGVSGDGQGRLQEEPDLFADAVARAAAKGQPARLDAVGLEALSEGRCVQTPHVGSIDDEARMVGRHHEIYLSDSRRVAPDKLRTIFSAGV